MPVRPKGGSGGSGFLGIRPVSIVGIESKNIDNIDVCIDIILQQEGSEYTDKCSIFGNFEYDAEGRIEENGFLKRIYRVFDGLGEKGGVNIKGMWVDENDNLIEDIEKYLSKYIAQDKYNYLIYLYKKQAKNGKVYTEGYPMLVPNTSQGRSDLAGYINFMKKKGYLKEYTETSANNQVIETPQGTVNAYNAGF